MERVRITRVRGTARVAPRTLQAWRVDCRRALYVYLCGRCAAMARAAALRRSPDTGSTVLPILLSCIFLGHVGKTSVWFTMVRTRSSPGTSSSICTSLPTTHHLFTAVIKFLHVCHCYHWFVYVAYYTYIVPLRCLSPAHMYSI